MLQNEEFTTTHGSARMSDAQYVGLLYRVAFDREPDRASLARYVPTPGAGTMSRADVQKSILGSDEFRARHPLLAPSTSVAPATPN